MKSSRHLRLATFLFAPLVAAACSMGQPTMPSAPPEEPQSSKGNATGPDAPPAAPPPVIVASETARYRVAFDARWSATSHPVDFPTGAHFSPLVGGTHSASATFWREGSLASVGVKDMAERGRTSPLDQEIGAAISAGTAERVFTNPPPDKSVGSVSFEFTISQRFPRVTLVTMVAPSPDWFLGVSGLSLFENGQWVEERRADLDPWDAGTDSGSTFYSPDAVTAPPAPISRILTVPLSPAGQVTPLGTFTFTRLE